MTVRRYPEALRLRLPRGMPEALCYSEWARQVLLRSLQAEGVSIRDGMAAVASSATRLSLGALHVLIP